MKKLLGILSGVLVVSPLATMVTSCSPLFNKSSGFSDPNQNDPIDFKNPNAEGGTDFQTSENLMKTREMNWASVLKTDYSSLSKGASLGRSASVNNLSFASSSDDTRSTLALKDLLKDKLGTGTGFNPYTDIGIVEDSKEYLLKNKGLGSAYRDKANLGSSKAANNEYNNLGKLWNDSSLFKKDGNDGITLGFMQNASDENELVPMWDAAPNKTDNKSADWFKARWDKWTNPSDGENKLDASKVTISFGPFANSLWHEAYKNGYNEEQLADKLAEISKNYGTKKFDFYFASPYLSNKGSYADSQRLLAGALKILLESDNEFDIRLSLVVSTKDGISGNGVKEGWNGDISLLSDEEFPLYMFTKFLGMNFRLNVVLPYLTVSDYNNANGKEDWELPVMKKAIEAVAEQRLILNSNVNGVNKYEVSDSYARMVITPWIGVRAEKAYYNFDANDAIELKKFANEKKIGQVSMFYLTRDYPSKLELTGDNANNYADKNALDQNIRSGSGYEKFTFAKALNGSLTKAKQEVKGDNIKDLDGFMDYDKDIRNNNSLDEVQKEQGAAQWDGVIGGNDNQWSNGGSTNDGNVVNPTTPTVSSQNLYVKWKDANPNRESSISEINNVDSSTYFSPYLDAGLYEGNDIKSVTDSSGLNHLTLAFVQQVNAHNDSLDLSIAGIENKGDGFEWWRKSILYGKALKPLIDSNSFENIKVAYGGATTGGYIEKNPWNLALKLANGDKNAAASSLATALKGYNQDLTDYAASESNKTLSMPKNIDFDIEGGAQNDDDSNDVLAMTLANMKKDDSSWNFSITLPVLPSGLTSVGYKVMDKFVKAYKEAGLSYKDMPVINLMLMDYGDPIYLEAISKGLTNFDLAQQAIESTKENIAKSIMNNYGISNPTNGEIHRLIGATPMIGVNDTVAGVFTLEDAKELYNWAHAVNLSYIAMWSMNDDRGKINNIARPKSLINHGLGYLNEYDFAKAFNGKWDDGVKNPNKL
ncbi:bifunctional chitinase/lysozyme [Spiroplasma corruscae]|uniref:Bifunctional chitinase/lysozyme n=1 Tax=Spiroplasma corruscae TaxID=216934 RepID=A0A222EP89_9MOLU|nr:hypothetical protein [Spiroplasma corruscae]ASP28329.1 bifunctional chitinase/lysozyme [Spiroplasma corruscae]